MFCPPPPPPSHGGVQDVPFRSVTGELVSSGPREFCDNAVLVLVSYEPRGTLTFF